MIISFVDIETNGLDTSNCDILEVAAVMYDSDSARVLCHYSTLLKHDKLYVPEVITKINGITEKMCSEYGTPAAMALNTLSQFLFSSHCVVAHNGNAFDRPIIERHFDEYNIPRPLTEWLDSKVDFKYPDHVKTRKLLHMMAEFNLTIYDGHQALNDALMLCSLVTTTQKVEDINSLLMVRKSNRVKICQ
jgi:DNA polymerase III epsilon subunit-like protein